MSGAVSRNDDPAIESSDDAIVSKTIDGVITSWNGGAERMLGWPAEMAIGSHITLIVPEERRAEFVELHGGHARAESAGKGMGATFTVALPLLG